MASKAWSLLPLREFTRTAFLQRIPRSSLTLGAAASPAAATTLGGSISQHLLTASGSLAAAPAVAQLSQHPRRYVHGTERRRGLQTESRDSQEPSGAHQGEQHSEAERHDDQQKQPFSILHGSRERCACAALCTATPSTQLPPSDEVSLQEIKTSTRLNNALLPVTTPRWRKRLEGGADTRSSPCQQLVAVEVASWLASTAPPGFEAKLRDLVESTPIVLFLKGRPEAPLCGFSSRALVLLEAAGAESYTFVDCSIHEQQPPQLQEKRRKLRAAVCKLFEWETLPLLVVKGSVVGGADIMAQLHQQGKLAQLLEEAEARGSPEAPTARAKKGGSN
ncbi:uncharacterized protein LOC113147206 [Cyclospora cayetanensis]|uniref:Uncharacterized protein LOC113147206 n=1 Tax=Cyclospora cayetanensis TaxID=88456 RepID=A0A6P6RXX9_9EIME|nr:uncharacterized protein LOC113147206 [Cyclospora cayetanensis]